MDYCILRLEKRKTAGAAAMARHALRDGDDTPNADPERRADNGVLVGPGTAAGVMAALRERLPAKRRKDAVTCIDFFVGASPEAMHAMTREQQDAYFRRALAFIGERFGGRGNVVSAVIHRDETTPHMQVLLVPLLDGKLNAKKLVGGRGDLQRLQDDFAAQVGEPAGLRRGERGSSARHTSIRQFYAAIEAASSEDALPPRRPVPRLPKEPEKPGLLAGRAARDDYERAVVAYQRAVEAREEAIQANLVRQEQIEKLARLAASTSRGGIHRARRKGERLNSRVSHLQAEIDKAQRLLEETRQRYQDALERESTVKQNLMADRLKGQAAIARLSETRSQLQAEVDGLQAQVDELSATLREHEEQPRPRQR